jgi:flavodoxin
MRQLRLKPLASALVCMIDNKSLNKLRKGGPHLKERKMKVLNLYFSATGNTEKLAMRIEETLRDLGHEVHTIKITDDELDLDILEYEFVFVGSGVYGQLPGKPMVKLFRKLIQAYAQKGEIKPASPRRGTAGTVVYCTYGGVHTGMNEAVPAVKYMGQLFDHLGYSIVAEWYVIGEYNTEKMRQHSVSGRLGDIRGRPNEEDLRDVAERVRGVLRM